MLSLLSLPLCRCCHDTLLLRHDMLTPLLRHTLLTPLLLPLFHAAAAAAIAASCRCLCLLPLMLSAVPRYFRLRRYADYAFAFVTRCFRCQRYAISLRTLRDMRYAVYATPPMLRCCRSHTPALPKPFIAADAADAAQMFFAYAATLPLFRRRCFAAMPDEPLRYYMPLCCRRYYADATPPPLRR